MVMTNFSCDVQEIESRGLSNLNPPPLLSHLTQPIAENLKRPRISDESDVVITNGFHEDTTTLPFNNQYPFVRLQFDAKFKTAIQTKLVELLMPLANSEKLVSDLKSEIDQLKSHMEHIEKSSNELKKIITEGTPLPVPTNLDGEQRSLSSQAPRIPQPPIQTSVSSSTCVTSSSLQSHEPLASTTSVSSSDKPVQINHDTIDLTSDPNTLDHTQSTFGPSTLFATLTTPLTANTNNVNFVNYVPNGGCGGTINAVPLYLTSVGELNTTASLVEPFQEKSLEASAQLPPPPPLVSNDNLENLVTFQTNTNAYLDISHAASLPIAPLPPVPLHPKNTKKYHRVQPSPQLTISEAAEGVCLQWTIYACDAYEPAISYEIFSYASSEVTNTTVKTYFPWKRVGEVTALPLPMACTLTHVQPNNMYYFIVRSVDKVRRYSFWSNVVNAYVS